MLPLPKLTRPIALGGLLIALLVSCGEPAKVETDQTALATLEVTATPVAATPIPAAKTITIIGQVEPVSWVELSFQRSSQVAEVLVEIGDTVTAGQVLARLPTREMELAVRAAQAALTTAQARLAEAAAPPRPEEIAVLKGQVTTARGQIGVAVAERDLAARPSSAAELLAAQSAVADAYNQWILARDRHDYTILNDQLGAPEEEARFAQQAAEAALAVAQAELAEVEAGPPEAQVRGGGAAVSAAAGLRDSAQASLDLLMAGTRPETLKVLEAEVALAEIALAQAKLALDQAALVAPFAGSITSLAIQPYQQVTANAPVIVLADLSRLQIRTSELDELFVPSVRLGHPVKITLDALPGQQFTGQVTFVGFMGILSEVEGEGNTYTVIISPDQNDPNWRWGMTAIATLLIEDS